MFKTSRKSRRNSQQQDLEATASKESQAETNQTFSTSQRGAKSIIFTQTDGTKVNGMTLNRSLIQRLLKKDFEAQFLPETKKNHVALLEHLIQRVIFSLYFEKVGPSYFYPCYHCFCRYEAKKGGGHKEPYDSVDLLLQKKEKKKILNFRAKLLKAKVRGEGTSWNFYVKNQEKIIDFLKKLKLNKLKKFVARRCRQRIDFFRFPVIKGRLNYSCPYSADAEEVGMDGRNGSDDSIDSDLTSDKKRNFFEKKTKFLSEKSQSRESQQVSPNKKLKVPTGPRAPKSTSQKIFKSMNNSPKRTLKESVDFKKKQNPELSIKEEPLSSPSDSNETEMDQLASEMKKMAIKEPQSYIDDLEVKSEILEEIQSKRSESDSLGSKTSIVSSSGSLPGTGGDEDRNPQPRTDRSEMLTSLRDHEKEKKKVQKDIKKLESRLAVLKKKEAYLDEKIQGLKSHFSKVEDGNGDGKIKEEN